MQRIYRIGYMLGDVKATLNEDVAVEVGGVAIRGRQGEVVGMPLWAGELLQGAGVVHMELSDAVTDLKQALIREQVVGEYQLATLDAQFYIRLRGQMAGLGPRDRDGVGGIMMELVRLRRGKIVRLADSSKLTGEMKSRMTVEERVFFEAINRESRRFEESVGYDE